MMLTKNTLKRGGGAYPLNKTRLGFTLAEVLVTLGIIGVVSSMTLPTLMKNHQRQVYVTQLHKVYNELSQASEAYINSRNAINLFEAGVSSQNGVSNFIQSQLKTTKNCGSTFTDCFASEYKNMNGAVVTNYNESDTSCYALPSGASICLTYGGRVRRIGTGVINAVVDVNGKSGPNILGRDLFVMGMSEDGSVVSNFNALVRVCIEGMPDYDDCEAENNRTDLQKCQSAVTMATSGDASYCFAQIQDDGFRMEY